MALRVRARFDVGARGDATRGAQDVRAHRDGSRAKRRARGEEVSDSEDGEWEGFGEGED